MQSPSITASFPLGYVVETDEGFDFFYNDASGVPFLAESLSGLEVVSLGRHANPLGNLLVPLVAAAGVVGVEDDGIQFALPGGRHLLVWGDCIALFDAEDGCEGVRLASEIRADPHEAVEWALGVLSDCFLAA